MLSLFFITSTQAAIGFLMPFYLQNIRGFSPFQMGWIIIANSVVIVLMALAGLGWAFFNAPNQSAILGSVPMEKAGTASGMTATTARTGGAMGISLSATLFTYGLTAAGLTQLQIESPQSWSASPEIFVRSFNHAVHMINFLTLLSVFFSAVKGARRI